MSDCWKLTWAHGELAVYELGGMLGGVRLRADDTRWVEPFYEAPWIGDGRTYQPELLGHLRSEFPCVPFGVRYPDASLVEVWRVDMDSVSTGKDFPLGPIDECLHGPASTMRWRLKDRTSDEIVVVADYPQFSPVSRLTRVVRCDPDRPAIDFSLTIESRSTSRRPVGIHPNFKLPVTPGAFRIVPGAFEFGVIHPAGPEKNVSRASPGTFFKGLGQVPLHDQTCAPFDRLPFAHDTEEIVQLCGTDGVVLLVNDEARTAYRLSWDASVLPSLLIWISNRGRGAEPWNGRNVCVGIEPLVGAFDLGSAVALASNPINRCGVATALKLDPENSTMIDYRIELVPYRQTV